jgi:serine/threonine-protein kinase
MSAATPTSALRVVLVDDSLLIRDGLARVLEAHGVEVAGQARDGTEALSLLAATRADVVVLDMRMPPSYTNEGVVTAEAVRRDHPRIGILVLAQTAEFTHVDRLLSRTQRGIGYLLKDRVADWSELSSALGRVAAGGTVLDPSVVEMWLLHKDSGNGGDPLAALTDRERVVLALMAEGLTNPAIAERLVVSGRTVESHVKAVFTKLGLEPHASEHRRVLAVLKYLRAGA